jgi:hypothetical protein
VEEGSESLSYEESLDRAILTLAKPFGTRDRNNQDCNQAEDESSEVSKMFMGLLWTVGCSLSA